MDRAKKNHTQLKIWIWLGPVWVSTRPEMTPPWLQLILPNSTKIEKLRKPKQPYDNIKFWPEQIINKKKEVFQQHLGPLRSKNLPWSDLKFYFNLTRPSPIGTTVAPSGIGNAHMPNNCLTFEILVLNKKFHLAIRWITFASRPTFQNISNNILINSNGNYIFRIC